MEPSAIEFVKASARTGSMKGAGLAIKAFVLANPVALAGIAGVVIGVVGYRILGPHGEGHSDEAEEV